MISLVILFECPLFMQSVSASYFKTIKQLICCDNHSHLCNLDYFNFECYSVKVFYNICCHGYQITESFRLPFVFSQRVFATILNATTFILLPSKCQLLYLGLGGQRQNLCFVVIGKTGQLFWPRPVPFAIYPVTGILLSLPNMVLVV